MLPNAQEKTNGTVQQLYLQGSFSPPLPSSIFFFLFFRCNRILKSSVVFRLFLLIDRIAGVDVEIGEGIVGANFGGDFMRFCLK